MNNFDKKNNVAAVIPFYNECANLNNIITQTINYVDTVIAVDDGSTDDSKNQIPSANNVILISSDKN